MNLIIRIFQIAVIGFFLHAFEQSKAFGAYLITGNLKHYPVNERIVSPGEFISYLTK